MTSPLASNGTEFSLDSAPSRARRDKAASAPSLALSRLQRALVRQAPLFVIALIAGAALGWVVDRFVTHTEHAWWFWLIVGATAGALFALVRELNRNTVTSLSGLGKHRGYAVLGAAPELTPRALRELPPDRRSALGALTLQPGAPFATAFRDLQSAIAGERVIAFLASLPDEGATTTALSAAISAAQQGRSVIIVDCDLRRRSLTHALECEPDGGVFEAVEHPETWRDYVTEEPETGLPFLPAAKLSNPWRSLLQPGFRLLLDQLRAEYDLVVLDCPPALGSAEGPMTARLADKCVLVVAWDRTPLAAVRASIRTLHRRARADTGIYVNRVPPGYRFGRLRPD